MKEGRAAGLEEGKALGIQLVIEAAQEMLIETLFERFRLVPTHLTEGIQGIRNQDMLKGLFHQALKCQTLQEFETILTQVG